MSGDHRQNYSTSLCTSAISRLDFDVAGLDTNGDGFVASCMHFILHDIVIFLQALTANSLFASSN